MGVQTVGQYPVVQRMPQAATETENQPLVKDTGLIDEPDTPTDSGRIPSAEPLAVILAAGRGTRMGGDRPKVLYEAVGKPLLLWVLEALKAAGVMRRVVVVGHRAADVEAAVAGLPGVSTAVQRQLRGTGDAVAAAAGAIRQRLDELPSEARLPVVIVTGDSPMLRPESVRTLLAAFAEQPASCLLGTALTDDPTGLGRIVRDAAGRFVAIVEEKDASEHQRAIREVNMSSYLFDARRLLWSLEQLGTDNAAGEYYLTDAPGILMACGDRVDALPCLDPSEALSVNTPQQLAAVAEALAAREG